MWAHALPKVTHSAYILPINDANNALNDAGHAMQNHVLIAEPVWPGISKKSESGISKK